MNPLRPYPRVSCALMATLGYLFLSASLAAKPPRHWNELKKVSKPAHEGIHAEMEASYFYLSYEGRSTCLPKTALLNLPESLRERVTESPRYRVLSWFDFMRVNRSWIHGYPISWEQATGKKEFSESVIKNFEASKMLMIATYQKNPISVRQPKGDQLTEEGAIASH